MRASITGPDFWNALHEFPSRWRSATDEKSDAAAGIEGQDLLSGRFFAPVAASGDDERIEANLRNARAL